MDTTADVVIVGAGLAGAAAAHFLAREGVAPVVLDRWPSPGREASGRSASIVRPDAADPVLAPWTARGAALLRTGELAPYRETGLFLVGPGEEDLSARVPLARGRGRLVGGGVVDAEALLSRLLSGIAVRHATVGSIAATGRGLELATSAGRWKAGVVVLAAGAWAGDLGLLPLEPRIRHLFVTAPAGAEPAWPIAWDDAEGLYFRPHAGGRLIACACDEEPSSPGDNAVRPEAAARLRALLERLQPGLAALPIEDSWAGQRTFAPDRRFVFGWDPRWPGVFWIAGLGGHGVTASTALGEAAAAMIAAGSSKAPPSAAEPLSPARLVP